MKSNLKGVYLCADCHRCIQTGGTACFYYYYYPEKAETRIKEVSEGIREFQEEHGNLHHTEGYNEFSITPCDACNTHLAGSRWEYETYIPEKEWER